MTYSIIARCPNTGRLGVGTTTFSIACGRRNESVRANVGISKSQAFYLRGVDPLALNLLAAGYRPQRIVQILAADDADFEYRQFGIIDREDNVIAYTGPKIGQWAGHKTGPYYAAYGNGLAGPQTVEGIVSGFLRHPDAPLEYRLLEALEGGRDAGGQATNGRHRPERSAWIRVVGPLDYPEIDVRVDLHDDTVGQLRRTLTEYVQHREYYLKRSEHPPGAIPEEQFVAGLSAGPSLGR
ncbi:MAG: DUF1028 domain-containing protein [Betaproteobacteria bacterium]|nr:DUF1028 domain-containing protein [Betaproteobacteria bacterium]